MRIDTIAGRIFMRRGAHRIRFVQKHQGIYLDFHYLESGSGHDFDVRDLPGKYLGCDQDAVHRGDRDAHRNVIERAISDGFDFGRI
jgi:hypothetical protein